MVVKNKIVVTGGSGRLAQSLKKTKCKYKFIYPTKTQLHIMNLKSIRKYLIQMDLDMEAVIKEKWEVKKL